ncbi:MAG: DUF3821 domain-containing protein, partial [Methanomicrobiales archaeon]|nr:DUF3821 domain-containing protein [Methanomicrobiales archaeon]
MKSMTKAMVIALFVLIAALVIATPVSARVNANVIQNGNTIFVYETGLDLANVSADITSLRHYSDFTAGTVDNTISVGNVNSFSVLSSDVAGIYGTYYAWNNSGLLNGTGTYRYVDIKLPSLTTDVVLNTSHVDSVNGKSITRASPIAFKISNNVAAAFPATAIQTVQIEVTTPDGGKITTFGNVAMGAVQLTASQIFTDTVSGTGAANDLTDVSPGTYTALAKWPSTSPFYKQNVDSNTVSFTVISKTVSIQSNKESVVRGNNFVVTIQGESNKRYWVYVEDGGVSASQYPLILDAQSGISNTFPVTGLDAAVTDEAGVAGTEANVTTTAAGTRPIEFNTTPATKDKSFTIKVVDPLDISKNDNVKVTVEKGKVTITAAGTGTYFLGEELTLTGTCTENKTNVHLFMTGPNLAT